ncbi:uncharacterized protein UTRI_10146 [Ustilago trichophora]|uniref:Uncharacterized protein n=1 Tax=Ustilago trichophora TaxID=86804 RepID=A0A5C3EA90_9BASI|nr:uncharacterized protein UTRI_10146 [Ustilago trichophora]
MSKVTCPVCSFAYAGSNITNHFRKAHSGVFVTQEAAAGVGLVACACGQLVLNAAALRKHQGIRKCHGAASQPAPPAPTTQPAASAVMQAESAPAALAVEQDDPFLQLVDPALLMDEQALQPDLPNAPTSDLDSSREDSPLALVDDNLDFVFAEADAETAAAATQEPAAEDVEMHDNFHNNLQEDASSGEVPDPFPIPSLDLPAAEEDNLQEGSEAGSEAGLEAETLEQEEDTGETLPQLPLQEVQAPQLQQLELDVPDMPEDGIVVLLPSMDSPTGPVPNLLLDSHAAEEPPMLPPIPGLSPITNWNVGVDTDVDSFAVTISPADILKIFPAGCYLSLISHAPDFKDLASFNSWVYFAELKVLFRFEPQFKLPLIQRLCQAPQKAILIPLEYATALTLGELRLDVGIVVEALQDIGCQNVRMGAYGIKVPVDRFLDPAMLSEHPMQESNVFDIGCTIDTGRVTLIAPKSKKGKYKQYPMALRVGRGFGSVELKWSSRTDGITHFKGYPKLTHLLKAGAAGAGQAGVPMTVKTVKDRISTLESWKQRIIGTAPELGSGVRLEVTVQAATMQRARAAAEASQYLDHRYLFSEAAGDQQLLTHTICKADMFADLDALLAIAEHKQIFQGNHSKQSSGVQRQAVIDLYNAMGWHPGRRPTALDSHMAWWETNQAALDLADELERFSTPASTKHLFSHVQAHLRCQGCHKVGTYALCGGANQFRIRCTDCRATLSAQKFQTHLALLASRQQLGVDLRALVVDPARLIFAGIEQEDFAMRKLSQRQDLNGLCRTNEFASMRESMLECLALHLEHRREAPGPQEIRAKAVDWLRENTQAVEHHLGTRSRPAAEACLEKLAERDAELSREEEVVLLHGVAGAFDVRIAHLQLLRRSWSCQVIPLGSQGPYLRLVQLSGGYEVLTQAQ